MIGNDLESVSSCLGSGDFDRVDHSAGAVLGGGIGGSTAAASSGGGGRCGSTCIRPRTPSALIGMTSGATTRRGRFRGRCRLSECRLLGGDGPTLAPPAVWGHGGHGGVWTKRGLRRRSSSSIGSRHCHRNIGNGRIPGSNPVGIFGC